MQTENFNWLIEAKKLRGIGNNATLPLVMLCGDSIRLQYQSRVQEMLNGICDIVGPPENGRFTKYTLWGMHDWVLPYEDRGISVIHFNNGAWDMHFVTADNKPFTPAEEYAKDIYRLYNQMKSITDQVIFATITPFKKEIFGSARAELTQVYNQAALNILKDENVPITDLYTLVRSDMDRYVSSDGCHLTDEGIEACAAAVSANIVKALQKCQD